MVMVMVMVMVMRMCVTVVLIMLDMWHGLATAPSMCLRVTVPCLTVSTMVGVATVATTKPNVLCRGPSDPNGIRFCTGKY